MNKTKIPWCDYTWNPIVGCSLASEGCQNCYAEAISRRFHLPWGKAHWIPERLEEPARVKKGGRVFVCSVSDLGHESVNPQWRLAVACIMMANPQHTYIILTKRPGEWLNMFAPLAWIGVTVENQEQAEIRIPELIKINNAIRFISVEPMLGPVDLTRVRFPTGCLENVLKANISEWGRRLVGEPNGIDWVIAGPETGPKARRCEDAWIDALAEQSPCVFDKRKDGKRREFPNQQHHGRAVARTVNALVGGSRQPVRKENMQRPILILGEHDKGLGVPFHPRTVSGGRLRRMLLEVGLDAILGNAYTSSGHPNDLHDAAEGMTVIALGNPARRLCETQGIPHRYLPHPACRSRSQWDVLRCGLASYTANNALTNSDSKS